MSDAAKTEIIAPQTSLRHFSKQTPAFFRTTTCTEDTVRPFCRLLACVITASELNQRFTLVTV